MFPDQKDAKWQDLVLGTKSYSFKSVPLGMMLSRHKREVTQDSSKENLESHINAVYSFFIKYEKILADDIKLIFG